VLDNSKSTVLWRSCSLIRDSVASRFLKERGYRYVNIRSGFWIPSGNPAADLELGTPEFALREFQFTLLQMTPLRRLVTWVGLVPAMHQNRVLSQLQALQQVHALGERNFVVAHIVCPHPPFVFDRDGGTLELGVPLSMNDAAGFPGTPEQYQRGYSEQVRFLNRALLEAIDGILAQYPPEQRPVIIVQGDHGSGLHFDLDNLKKGAFKERVSILSAMLLPADRRFEVSDAMTPVNSFRMVFNGLFETRLPLLPEKTLFVADPSPGSSYEVSEADY
jgi:hypothetical protein